MSTRRFAHPSCMDLEGPSEDPETADVYVVATLLKKKGEKSTRKEKSRGKTKGWYSSV